MPSSPTFRQLLGRALNRTPRIKRAVKGMTYWLPDPLQRGRALEIGGRPVRVPARFARAPWTNYETESTVRVAEWLQTRPTAALLDIGCSVGVYSALALAQSPQTEAYAFDADLVSLKATLALCRHVGAERLHPIHGFIAERNAAGLDAGRATAATRQQLADARIPADPEACTYTCIDATEHQGIPTHAIDGLFAAAPARPYLIKCDVEGAELLVLRGAAEFARRHRPQLLISVHAALAGFGQTPDDVAAWMREHGYRWDVATYGHEDHWWCEPVN